VLSHASANYSDDEITGAFLSFAAAFDATAAMSIRTAHASA
jgi:hypothetical protein